MFEQALELAPDFAPAWIGLGDARQRLGRRDAAAAAFARAAALDPRGTLGAQMRLAALGAIEAPGAPPSAWVSALFDEYAPRFDTHLVKALAYRGPELLMSALERACLLRGRAFKFARALDLGCGTGLMGRALAPHAGSLRGADISPAMIEIARTAGFYAELHVCDLSAYLETQADGGSDLVIAADTFVYAGDLSGVFAQGARALMPGGLFAFTLQSAAGNSWSLGADLRYAHSRGYIDRLAAQYGFDTVILDEASARRDAGADVPGLVCVLARP